MLQLLSRRERRTFPRAALPLDAVVNGRRHHLLDISVGGFRVASLGAQYDEVEDALFRIDSEHLVLELRTVARLIFADPSGWVGFEFVNLSPEQALIIEGLCTSALDDTGTTAPGDSFLRYAVRRADRAIAARYAVAPVAI